MPKLILNKNISIRFFFREILYSLFLSASGIYIYRYLAISLDDLYLTSLSGICNLAKSPTLLESSINLKLLLITLHYLRHGATFGFERAKFRFHSPCPRDHDPLAAYRYTQWLRKVLERSLRMTIKIRISSSKALKKNSVVIATRHGFRDYT